MKQVKLENISTDDKAYYLFRELEMFKKYSPDAHSTNTLQRGCAQEFPTQKGKWIKKYRPCFDGHNTFAPINERIIDELLCDKFKRK